MAETLNIVVQKDASDEWLRFIMNERAETRDSQPQRPKIQKVPLMLSRIESNKECYHPLVVSIGPYHHGKPELNDAERVKVTMARQFVQDSRKSIEVLYNKVAEMAKDARKSYAEGSTEVFDDKAFTQMMFLDGCFILQFIFCLLRNPENLKMNSHIAASIKRDLFLLENQLPFQVLMSLMSLRFEEEEGKTLIKDFINDIRALPHQQDSCNIRAFPNHQPIHFLELFHNQFIDKKAFIALSQGSSEWHRYRPTMELKEAGICIEPSRTNLFTDVKFNPTFFAGTLKLPPITIDDSTKSLLLNLVAYELCLDSSDELGVVSYICFMDSLIDNVEDVKELRSKGIFLNTLRSDREIADLFNEMGCYLVPNPYAYIDVKRLIELHYKNIFKTWIAQYQQVLISGKALVILSVYASLFGVILSAMQTYVTVSPNRAKTTIPCNS